MVIVDFIALNDSKKLAHMGFQVRRNPSSFLSLFRRYMEDITDLPDHPEWSQGH